MERSFTIIDFPETGKNYGRYLAKTPKRAAHKAFSRLSQMINLKNSDKKNFMVFTIKETTQNSDNKKFKYVGTRVELDQPKIVSKNGKMIEYKYRNVIAPYDKVYK